MVNSIDLEEAAALGVISGSPIERSGLPI